MKHAYSVNFGVMSQDGCKVTLVAVKWGNLRLRITLKLTPLLILGIERNLRLAVRYGASINTVIDPVDRRALALAVMDG
jgi:hypothetical protein